MCRLRNGVAILMVAATGPISAQPGPSPSVRAMARRVESVRSYWLDARAALRRWDDSVARSRSLLDTLRVGHLRLFVAPHLRERVDRAARLAAAHVDSLAGAAAARLTEEPFVVRQVRASEDTIELLVIGTGRGVGFGWPAGSERSRHWGDPSDSIFARWLADEALRVAQDGMEPAFRRWLRNVGVRPDTASALAWMRNRLDLVSSGTLMARRCYEGDLAACAIALDLRDVADPVTQWYDAPLRRLFVEQLQPLRAIRRDAFRRDVDWSAVDRCLDGVDADCIAVMRAYQNWGIASASTGGQRASLVQLALQTGGRGAFERLLTGRGAPTDILTAAAGVPLDSLLSTWQRRVRDTRLPAESMSPGIALTSLAWMLVCGALALQSSRWR